MLGMDVDDGRARPRPAHRQGRRRRGARLPRVRRRRGDRPATTPASTLRGGAGDRAARSAPATTSARGARPGASPSTSRRCTARSTRPPQPGRRRAVPPDGGARRTWVDLPSTSPSSATARPGWRSPPPRRRRARRRRRRRRAARGRRRTARGATTSPTLPDHCFAARRPARRRPRPPPPRDRAAVRRSSTTTPCAPTSPPASTHRAAHGRADPPHARGGARPLTTTGDVDARIVVDATGTARRPRAPAAQTRLRGGRRASRPPVSRPRCRR